MNARPLVALLLLLACGLGIGLARPLAARAARPAGAEATAAAVPPVTVVLVRHAETPTGHADPDPALTEAGGARAASLARLLGRAGVTHLFATTYRRTQATLAPLAEAIGLEVRVLDAAASEELAAALRALAPGSVAVVAGHSNTVPGLVRLLGGEAEDLQQHPTYGPMLPSEAFDRLFVVTLPASEDVAAKTLELRY